MKFLWRSFVYFTLFSIYACTEHGGLNEVEKFTLVIKGRVDASFVGYLNLIKTNDRLTNEQEFMAFGKVDSNGNFEIKLNTELPSNFIIQTEDGNWLTYWHTLDSGVYFVDLSEPTLKGTANHNFARMVNDSVVGNPPDYFGIDSIVYAYYNKQTKKYDSANYVANYLRPIENLSQRFDPVKNNPEFNLWRLRLLEASFDEKYNNQRTIQDLENFLETYYVPYSFDVYNGFFIDALDHFRYLWIQKAAPEINRDYPSWKMFPKELPVLNKIKNKKYRDLLMLISFKRGCIDSRYDPEMKNNLSLLDSLMKSGLDKENMKIAQILKIQIRTVFLEEPDTIPNTRVVNLNGDTLSLYDIKARKTVLGFYNRNCWPCEMDLSIVDTLALRKEIFPCFIIIPNNTSVKEVTDYLMRNRYFWDGLYVVLDTNFYRQFRLIKYPSYVHLDKNKRIIGCYSTACGSYQAFLPLDGDTAFYFERTNYYNNN